nr:reverse transcriptase N-terminal domain-containing protein [Dorea longicatena]
MRIAKAVKENRVGKIKSLQWTLTHSFYAKAIAVKRVTENKGKRTPGVDGVCWISNEDKFNAIFTLQRRGYQQCQCTENADKRIHQKTGRIY